MASSISISAHAPTISALNKQKKKKSKESQNSLLNSHHSKSNHSFKVCGIHSKSGTVHLRTDTAGTSEQPESYKAGMSQNTKQIMLKKLMKDIEMAIRASDIQDKGQVDIREFKQCLYNLNYLQAL